MCKNIRFFCKKVFSIDTFCYDSLLQLCLLSFSLQNRVFRSFWSFFLPRVIIISYISVFYSFLPPLVCYVFRSIPTFTCVHFSFYCTCYVAQQLGNKEHLQQVKARSHSLVKLANLDGLQRTVTPGTQQYSYYKKHTTHDGPKPSKRIIMAFDYQE